MATGALIPVGEYLKNLYRPDCDYVDGKLEERSLGEFDHSALQRQFLRLLGTPASELYVSAYQELRVQVSETRFRVPDVCVRAISAPHEQIIRTPPLVCIEILSPEDTISRMRVRDFLDMGVEQVWLVDAMMRAVILCCGSTMTEETSGEITVPGTPVTVDVGAIFSVLEPL